MSVLPNNVYEVQVEVRDKNGGVDVVTLNIEVSEVTGMEFSVQPQSAKSGESFQYVVHALNGEGQVATSYNGPVTLTLASGPGGGVLSGTVTVNAVNGVAIFSDLSLNRSGVYTVQGQLASFTQTSMPLTITYNRLVFATVPEETKSGQVFKTVVRAVDVDGVVSTPFNGPVTITGVQGTVTGETTVNAVNGVATFTNLILNRSGLHNLKAQNGEESRTSSPIQVSPYRLVYTTVPRITRSGQAFQVVVQAYDIDGVLASSYNGPVTIRGGHAGVGGVTTVNAVNGVATFNRLILVRSGIHYLTAQAGKITQVSPPISVSPQRLVLVSMPRWASAGTYFSITVRAVDADGVLSTHFNGPVTIRNLGGALGGQTTVNAVNGVGHFQYLMFPKLGLFRLRVHSAMINSQAASNPLALPPDSPLVTVSDLAVRVAFFGRRQPLPATP